MTQWLRALGALAEDPGPLIFTNMVAHSCLETHFQGIRYLLRTSTDIRKEHSTHAYRQAKQSHT